jgi:hypothetical protein
MTVEEIVRALAARRSPDCDSIPPTTCLLCGAEEIAADHYIEHRGRRIAFPGRSLTDPANHKPDCPWRLACEWDAEHPRTRRDGDQDGR